MLLLGLTGLSVCVENEWPGMGCEVVSDCLSGCVTWHGWVFVLCFPQTHRCVCVCV